MMALWDIYIEYAGYPIEVTLDFPDDLTEDEVWEYVHQDTDIEVTKWTDN
jgi:hypothetical protein